MIRFANVASVTAPMHTASENIMRQSAHSDTRDVVSDCARFLRTRHPRDTAKGVAQDTGLCVRTVEKILQRRSKPSWGTTVAFVLTYGPDFLSAVLPAAPAWLDRAVRAEHQAMLEAEQARISRELEALSR